MDTSKLQLVSAKQVMEILGISRTSLWRLMKKGVLEPVPLPMRDLRFRLDEIQELVYSGDRELARLLEEAAKAQKNFSPPLDK